MPTWREETERYRERVETIARWPTQGLKAIPKVPPVPLPHSPGEESWVATIVAITSVGMFTAARSNAASFSLLWREGQFMSISLPARLVFELWGAVRYGRGILDEMAANKAADAQLLDRCCKLSRGMMEGSRLPWGAASDLRPIHVSKFIESLKGDDSSNKGVYLFLTESSHPCNNSLTFRYLMTASGGNWSNKVFSKEAHE